MNGADILTTVAQLGAAVAGFSGIVIAFNRHPGRLNEFEAFRVSILFSNSFAAVFLALIPFPLFLLGWDESKIWRTASGLMAVFEAVFLQIHFPAARRFRLTHRQLFNLKLLTFVTVGHVMNGIAQLCNALGLIDAKLATFVFGLLWILFHSAFQFGRILFVQPAGSETTSASWKKSPGETGGDPP